MSGHGNPPPHVGGYWIHRPDACAKRKEASMISAGFQELKIRRRYCISSSISEGCPTNFRYWSSAFTCLPREWRYGSVSPDTLPWLNPFGNLCS